MVLIRTDPFRELDRWTQQVLGTAARPAVMPMDAWRDGEQFVVEFDLPGAQADSLGLDVERNVLTVRAERPDVDQSREMVTAERPRGVPAGNCSSGTTSIPTRTRPPTTTASCGSRSRWPKKPSPAISRPATTPSAPRSTPNSGDPRAPRGPPADPVRTRQLLLQSSR